MPLYEYACLNCKAEFEALVRSSEVPTCPSCQGHDLQRKLSTFAAHANGAFGSRNAMPGMSACGACGDPRGPGACSSN